MGWQDNLLKGSFRGVPFVTESTDGELGRRVAMHEYPLRDKPYVEDMGRKARRFSLEIYVVGADYMISRDLMVKAIEAPGSGKLVHPYRGEMTVTVLEARGPRETNREGGMARFSVTFVEAGEDLYPSSAVVGDGVLRQKSSAAAVEIRREFAENFEVSGPDWISDEAVSLITEITNQLQAIKDSLPVLPEQARAFADDLLALATEAESLIRNPADLAVSIYEMIANIALLPDRLGRAVDAYRPLFNALSGVTEVDQTTASRQQQADNQKALIELTRRAAAVEAARSVPAASFASQDEAIAVRDELADLLDAQMYTADDASFASLGDLRAELVRYVAAHAGDLARLVNYTPPVTLPALLIAHRLYGDASRDAEIIDRNRIAHPGFVPGGVAIEVLTDA